MHLRWRWGNQNTEYYADWLFHMKEFFYATNIYWNRLKLFGKLFQYCHSILQFNRTKRDCEEQGPI